MREVGIAVWVILLVVGVVGSMVSSVRRQMQSQAQSPRRLAERPRPFAPPCSSAGRRLRRRQLPRRGCPRPSRAASSRRRRAAPAHDPAHEAVRRPKIRFFSAKGELVRAVIAAEVLGKPRGLSDEYFPR